MKRCGKQVWRDSSVAELSAKARSLVAYKKQYFNFTVYKCPKCEMFHLTSNKPKVKK